MATIKKTRAGLVVAAVSEAEFAMLEERKEIVLADAIYLVDHTSVVLPAQATLAMAQRVRLSFEKAALAEREAKVRRDGFRLV